MSGFPGRSARCNLNRRPAAWAARLTVSSGVVFFDPTRDMSQDRRWGVIWSVTYSAACSLLSSAMLDKIVRKMASAIIGATLFPIIRKLCQVVGWKR